VVVLASYRKITINHARTGYVHVASALSLALLSINDGQGGIIRRNSGENDFSPKFALPCPQQI
jgi:hypothetical protein